MTTKPARYLQPSSRQLLGHIFETPELLSAVRQLPPRVLGKLIEHVGLEDSSELVALATTDQLRQIFDEDLWRSERPGKDESFDADRFVLWLEVMLEAGEELAVRKLTELPPDLVTLALHRHILVINADELSVEMADSTRDFTLLNKALDSCLYHEFSEYQVISRRHDGWDAILTVLVALDKDHHEFVQRILERCCHMAAEYIEENGGLYRVLNSDEILETDLAADREDRRASQGFVAPSAAASFLGLARITALEEIESQGRDPVTRAYFRQLTRDAAPAGTTPAPNGKPAAQERSAEVKSLIDVLRDAEVLPASPPALLPEANASAQPSHATAATTLFSQAIAELQQRAPDVHSARMAELAYLANVVVAGCQVAGRSFRPLEAAQTVVAVCNLGLERTLQRGNERGVPARHAVEVLERENADKLFRLGWHLLHQLAMATAAALERALSSGLAPEDRQQPAIRKRVAAALRSAASSGKPWQARRRLDALEAVFDEGELVALRALLDEYPSLDGALRARNDHAELELIATHPQLKRVAAFLETLTPRRS